MTRKISAKNDRGLRAARERPLFWLVSVSLAVIVWLAFGQAIHGEFVNYDDGDYVYENPSVISGLTLNGISLAFTRVHAANWHPLTTISHMLDCQIYGLQPWGHHLTNILLHTATAILLFFAFRKLSGALWPSASVATLFAVHPLRVESVAWVSERKDVLSGVFFALTLLAYASYARGPRRSVGRYLIVLLLFALGLMCKPTLVTLPFVLLLLDYWPLSRCQMSDVRGQKSAAGRHWSLIRDLIVEKIPLFLLSVVSCMITVHAQKAALDTNLNATLSERIANAIWSYVAYLKQMFYPTDLSVAYPYGNITVAQVVGASIFLLAISSLVLAARRKYPFLMVGWFWYLGMLVPMIGLVQVGVQPRADRYTYLPEIGLSLLLTWGALALSRAWPWKRAIAAVAGSLVVIGLTLTTRAQTSYWHDSEVLWRHAADSTPDNYIAYNDLGTLLLRQGQPEAALIEFQKALQIKPDFENPYVSGGSALMLMGQVDQAIGYYRQALRIRSNSAEDWSNLATALWKKGEIIEAIEDYKKAAAFKPGSAEMQYNLGHAFAGNRNWRDAISCYQAAIRLGPDEAKFHNNLAAVLVEVGRIDEAVDELRIALRINPNYPDAHYNLGSILGRLGKKEESAAHLREALRLKPDYENARKQLSELGLEK